ncbi:MAG: hypothetical protein GXO73_00715 [Calditrichaeota bacterium]|nr:hypothetical protein [Calditrichota bacterium]
MTRVKVNQLVITCEACGNVKKFDVSSQEECEVIFRNFRCENNCGRNLYSYITLGTLETVPDEEPVEQSAGEPAVSLVESH